jgi:hypothetical protein
MFSTYPYSGVRMKKLFFILSIIFAFVLSQTVVAQDKPAAKKMECNQDSTCAKMKREDCAKKCCTDTTCCKQDKKCSKEACCKKADKDKCEKPCSKDSCKVKTVKEVKKNIKE